MCYFFFFFNDTATTEIYTLSLHDALPICSGWEPERERRERPGWQARRCSCGKLPPRGLVAPWLRDGPRPSRQKVTTIGTCRNGRPFESVAFATSPASRLGAPRLASAFAVLVFMDAVPS